MFFQILYCNNILDKPYKKKIDNILQDKLKDKNDPNLFSIRQNAPIKSKKKKKKRFFCKISTPFF